MAEETPRRLLNPFVFPSETQLRFSLLIWAILSLCWGVGYFFTAALGSSAGRPALSDLPALERDVLEVEVEAPDLPLLTVLARQEAALSEKLAGLSEPAARERTDAALVRLSQAAHDQWVAAVPYLVLPFVLILLAALLIAALCVARVRGPWSGRRPASRKFLAVMDGLVEDAQRLQRELGEKPLAKPVFQVSRGAIGDGQTYGTSRRPRIILTRAVPLLLRKEIRQYGTPSSTRALVFHELAHIANRDVVRSYLAEASWVVSFPILASLVAVLWLTWSAEGIADPRYHPAVVSLQVLGTLLVVELIRRGLLRSREYFADLRVDLFWQAGDPLRAKLRRRDERCSALPGYLLRPWLGLWEKHPTPEERREVLDNPNLLFGIRKDAAFLGGLLFGSLLAGSLLLVSVLVIAADGLAVQAVADLARKYCEQKGHVYAMQFYYRVGLFGWALASAVFTYGLPVMAIYLLAGTLGVQAQRESVLQVVEDHLHSHPYRALWRPAFLAALGCEAGLLLAPLGPALPGSAGAALRIPLWVGYATLLLWLWLATLRFFARRILGQHVAARTPSRRLIGGMTLASSVLLLPLAVALLGAQLWMWPGTQSVGGGTAVVIGALGLLLFTVILVLMLFVFALWQTGRQGARKPRCPSCHNDPAGTTVADCCAICGKSLAPWLLIPSPRCRQGAPA